MNGAHLDILIANAQSRRDSAIKEIARCCEWYFTADPISATQEIARWMDRVKRAELDMDILDTLRASILDGNR